MTWRRTLSILARVLLLLVLVDCLVAGPFVNRVLLPHYVTPYPVLRDRTGGKNTSVLFEALQRLPNPGVRVAFVGDSTMNSADGPDQSFVPLLIRADLARRFPGQRIETVDASLLGLYGSSAALFIAKLLGDDTDVVVYGITPRAFPTHPATRWISTISTELSAGDVLRLTRAGGGPWLFANLSAEDLLTGLIKSDWSTYAFRSEVRMYLADRLVDALAPQFPPLRALASREQQQESPPVAARSTPLPPYEWMRDDYGIPNANWAALRVIGELCQIYAPGRCLIYGSPINPLLREQLYEPGLYQEYLREVRVVAGRYGVAWRDYTDALTPAHFRKPKYGGVRDPIHMNPEGRAKLAGLLAEPVGDAIERALRARIPPPPGSGSS